MRTRHVRFCSTVDLVNALEQEKTANRPGQLAKHLLRLDAFILDELGYLPFSPLGGAKLFHLLSKLCERTRVVIATKLSLSEWSGVFGNAKMTTALPDRLNSPLPHPGNRQRQLPLPRQHRCDQSQKGEASILDLPFGGST